MARSVAKTISAWERCPYRKVKACGANPSSPAMARQVAESSPPLNRTTALGLSARSVDGVIEGDQAAGVS